MLRWMLEAFWESSLIWGKEENACIVGFQHMFFAAFCTVFSCEIAQSNVPVQKTLADRWDSFPIRSFAPSRPILTQVRIDLPWRRERSCKVLLATWNIKGVALTRKPRVVTSYTASQATVRRGPIRGGWWVEGHDVWQLDRMQFEKGGVTWQRRKKDISLSQIWVWEWVEEKSCRTAVLYCSIQSIVFYIKIR